MRGFAVCILVIAATLQVSRGQLEQKVARIDDFLQSVAGSRNLRNPKIGPGPQKQKLESRYVIKPSRQSEIDLLGNGGYSTVVMAAQQIGGQLGSYSNAEDANGDVPDDSLTTKAADVPSTKAEEKEQPQFIASAAPAPVRESGMVAMYQSGNCSGAGGSASNDCGLLPFPTPIWPPPMFPPGFPPSWLLPEERIIRIPHPIPVPVPHPVPVIVHKFIPYPMPHPVPYPMSLR